jgi:hypothetical protein
MPSRRWDRGRWRRLGGAIAAAGIALVALPCAAGAQGSDPNCLSADLPALTKPAHSLRFGITPLLAGSVGNSQLEPLPANRRRARAALRRLRPARKQLVLRLNRMFWADGVEGIHRYAEIVDRYARSGFDTELQVRYHPPEGREGDMPAWRRYVRRATRILTRRESVVALSITNEANFDVSPNTSDGSYEGVRRAVIEGTEAADDVLRRVGRRDVELGFSFAWRWVPSSDREFWEEIGRLATPRFRRALDYVGLQIYPGLVFPPAPRPGVSAGDEVVEALTLMRRCYMPKAGLGSGVDLWVSENGYATNLGRSEPGQREALSSTLESVHDYSGTLGISDYRYFNLRDNNSAGPDLFDAVGVLRDDYSRKPAFATLRDGIRRTGERRPRGR